MNRIIACHNKYYNRLIAHLYSNRTFRVGVENVYLTFDEFKDKYEEKQGTDWYNKIANTFLKFENEYRAEGLID